MRILPRHLVLLAVSLAIPIGAGCSGGNIAPSGAGGTVDGSSVGFGETTATGGPFVPLGTWLKHYGDAADQRASAVAVSPAGEIALAATAKGSINFGNIPWDGSATDTDVVVSKLSNQGQSLWSRRYGDSCDQHAGAVAHVPSGNVLLAGDFCGKMDFGTTSVATKGAEVDLFVAVIDTLGEDVYSRSFGGKGAQIARAAVVDPLGNAVIVGSFDQAFDDGGGEKLTAGLDDGFVLQLDPKGALVWSVRFGGTESDIPRSVALDLDGNIVVGGSFGGSVDFGGGPLTAPVDHQSGFVFELDPTGKHLWSKVVGGDTDSVVNAVAVSPKGAIAAAGTFTGTAELGGDPVPSAGFEDGFLAVMDGAGNPTWGRALGGEKNQRGVGVTFALNDDVAVCCTSDAVLDLGTQFLSIPVQTPAMPLSPSMIFTFKLDAAGTPQQIWALEGNDALESVGIGFDPSFGLVQAGSFKKSLGSVFGPAESAGGWDVFLEHEM